MQDGVTNKEMKLYSEYKNKIESLEENIKANLEKKEHGMIDAMKSTIELMDLMVKAKENKNLEELFDESYGVIYSVIVAEQIYDKNNIIKLLEKNPKYISVKEGIVKYYVEDAMSINNDNNMEGLSNINSSDTYEFINENNIDKIVEAKFHEEKADFYNRKAEYLGDLKKRIFEFQREGKSNKEDRADALKEMAGIRVKRVFNLAKLLSYVVVPVLAIGGGYQLGVHLSNQIDEYKTTTRVVDPVTHEVVETLKEEYDERDTPYTSTLKLYEAWKKNPKGNGYVRKVTAYVTDPSADPLDTTGLTEKYHYTESKETLSEKDNTDESVTLLTETVQDKNDSRKSRKYVVWLIIAGVVLAGAIDGLLAYNMGVSDIFDELSELSDDKRSTKRHRRNLRREHGNLKKLASSLTKECETANNIYQFGKNELSVKVIKKAL